MGTLTVGLTNTGHALEGEILSWVVSGHGPVDSLPARPQALVITGNRDVQNWVALTVNPRGYRIVFAETAGHAGDILRSEASRIGVVVLDTQTLGAERVVAMAQSLAPEAKLVRVGPHPAATEISQLLVGVL